MILPPVPTPALILPVLILPALKLPVTAKLVSVPTLVILGCAFVYTVPAINALAT